MTQVNILNAELKQHKLITPSDTVPLSRISQVYANSAGNITVKDKYGTSIPYAVTAGMMLPVMCAFVMATGTTATSIVQVLPEL